ncbi:MAG: DUF1902 domain-containing protein [Gammaproteobacteria bacterium]
MTKRLFTIRCDWDAEARVWYVAESEVPGLSLEAPTQQEMTAKLRRAVPELLELNGLLRADLDEVPVSLLYARRETMRRMA